jgi:bifunctional UDP-N-acetylglucosamine pyrophosphorylase/glucosamine-1-phosphate N-acetyltransferase
MRAVVLAAGRGTRMMPLTAHRPKVLLPAGGTSLLGTVLDRVSEAGIDEATVVVGYGGKAVRETVGDGSEWGLDIDYAVQDPPKGTGDALACAGPFDEDVLVVNGDVLVPPAGIRAVAEADGWAVAGATVDDPAAYGVLDVEDGALAGLQEKPSDPASDRVNAGVYRVPADVGDRLEALETSERGEVELTDALRDEAEGGDRPGVVPVDDWLDVGRPWDLLAAADRVLGGHEARVLGEVEDGASLRGPVHVAEGARVRDGAYIEGPVHVGPGSDVGPNCYVRPSTVLEGDNRVGNAVEIKNSVLCRGATVGHHAYVGDSVLGDDVNLGAGTKVANLRHDGASIRVTTGDEVVDSGRRKLGVILGPEAKTGINTSLNVGVVLGPGAGTLPGEAVLESRY